MVRVAGVLLLAVLQGCCMLCTTVRLSYQLQVRSADGPVAEARVTLVGTEGLAETRALTDKNGRCEFSLKEVREFMSRRGSLGSGFHISILHPDFIPLRYLVNPQDLIRDDSDYSRSEAVQLRRFHFTLWCDPADQPAAAVPLLELLAKEDLKARIVPVSVPVWGYGAGSAAPIPGDSLAVVLLITPGLLGKSPEILMHLKESKGGAAGRPILVPAILGPVSDERRAVIQFSSRLSAPSIAVYDGRTPLTADQLKGLLELLRGIAAEPQR